MRISVKEDPALTDIEVAISCPRIDPRVRRLVAAAEIEGMRIAGMSDGFLCTVGANDVLYAETVDAKTFLYTADKAIESGLTLAGLEASLARAEFMRASRQLLVNLAHVQGLRPYLNARLELVLDNGEHVIASRQFSAAIKKRIGL